MIKIILDLLNHPKLGKWISSAAGGGISIAIFIPIWLSLQGAIDKKDLEIVRLNEERVKLLEGRYEFYKQLYEAAVWGSDKDVAKVALDKATEIVKPDSGETIESGETMAVPNNEYDFFNAPLSKDEYVQQSMQKGE